MALSRKYIMLFGDTRAAVDELDDDAAGRLFKAVLHYAERHEEVELSGEERYVYRMLMAQFARDEEAYRKRSEQNRQQHASRVSRRQQVSADFSTQYKEEEKDEDKEEDKEEYKDGSPRGRLVALPARQTLVFTPPTPDEVRSYCQEARLSFDADRFCDYNASRGWMQGNRPIADWKAAARLWASRGDLPSLGGGARGGKVLEQQQYTQREYTNSYDALDRMMAKWAKKEAEEAASP